MKYGLRWMDSDMHLAEPGDLWQRYIEPELRDRVPELTGVTPNYDVLSRSQIPAIEQIRKGRSHRLEEEWEKFRVIDEQIAANVTMPPIEYWKRQCLSSVEVDEWPLRSAIDQVGDENFVVSSDFPHFDSAFPNAFERFMQIPNVSDDSRRKILWDNCARLYSLN
jgi:hypothetical protein